ncbi:hypothetical protein C1645_834326 [Glomus cerebriforme]|uniref:Uncharacterized protein n=1 Tax=Glomus cerebriforme TaxID=658196 RepID=A0A397S9V3_9GLOM|nr:hypothetical protein C1645_834326 [Glomus cerebriforme]
MAKTKYIINGTTANINHPKFLIMQGGFKHEAKEDKIKECNQEIIEELEKNIKEYSNDITTNDSKYNTNRESIEYITSQKNELLSDKAEMERDLLQKSEEYERLEGQLKEMKREYDEKKDQVTKTEELFVNLSYGLYRTNEVVDTGRSYKAKNNVTRDASRPRL